MGFLFAGLPPLLFGTRFISSPAYAGKPELTKHDDAKMAAMPRPATFSTPKSLTGSSLAIEYDKRARRTVKVPAPRDEDAVSPQQCRICGILTDTPHENALACIDELRDRLATAQLSRTYRRRGPRALKSDPLKTMHV